MKDKLIPKSRFHWLLGFTALLIALCAACFSVYGIATLFAGAAISVMIMGGALELGKLVGTTFLYRYWSKSMGILKTYMVASIIVLMIITSAGIFGYLSSAYQKSSIEFSVTQEKIKTTEDQKPYYQDQITAAKKRIEDLSKIRSAQEARMGEAMTNEFLSRNVLQLRQIQEQTTSLITQTDKDIREANNKIQTTIDDIRKIDDQVNQLKLGSAEKKDIQTFKFVADALGMSLDSVAQWFIISVIFVFDPLAICLILAYNVVVYRKEDERVYDKPLPTFDSAPHMNEPVETPKVIITDSPSKADGKPAEPVTQSNVIVDNYELDKNLTSPAETPVKDDRTGWFKAYFKQS